MPFAPHGARSCRIGLLALALAGFFASGCGGPGSPHSLLLISVDTLRADRLGCFGSPSARTPVWDRLARRGLQVATTRSVAPFTLPSHASILTGDYPFHHRARRNGSRAFVPTGTTLAEALATIDLRCGAVTASTVLDAGSGLDRGFEHFDAPRTGGTQERSADRIVEAACRWLGELPPDARWFLFAHFYDPHDPYEPRAPWNDLYAANLYDGEIAATDLQIGRLLRRMTAAGRMKDALVVAVSDHGESFGEHEETGHGFFLYDATLRVPLVMSGPPPFNGGRLRTTPARTIDIYPTLMAAFHLTADRKGAGFSLLDAPPSEPTSAYSETFHAALAYGAADLRSLQLGDWKYVRSPKEELYDLRRDPEETENRVLDEPERVDDLRDRIALLVGEDLHEPAGLADEDVMDEERAEQLRALGYLATGRWKGSDDWETLPDPKDFAGIPLLLDEALLLAQAEHWETAIPLLERVLAKDATNPTALRMMAKREFDRGNDTEGFAWYEHALSASPERAKLWGFYGQDLIRFDRREDALLALERSVALDPTDLTAHRRLAEVAMAVGRPEYARQQIEEILRRDPNNRRALGLLRRLE